MLKKGKEVVKKIEVLEEIEASIPSFDATLSEFEGDLKKVLDKYQDKITLLAEVFANL